MKIAPWHALDQSVFHDNTKCEAGAAIERDLRLKGDARRERCDACAELNKTPNFTPPNARGGAQTFDTRNQQGKGFDTHAGSSKRVRRTGNR